MSVTERDFIIIGGGIIGLVLGYKVKMRYPNKTVLVIEKEQNSVCHGTGRNSGVIHSGIYYPPETLRAKYCVSGSKQLKSYVIKRNLWIDQCGKILLPTSKKTVESIPLLLERANQNGVEASLMNGAELRAMEPNCHPLFDLGVHVPFTSVVDPKEVAGSILADLLELDGEILYGHKVTQANAESGAVVAGGRQFIGRVVINAAGLHADKIAGLAGLVSRYSFLPFKGKYWRLDSSIKMRKLVYPIPNLELPFLGVHTAHNRAGDVYLGPSSTPVFGRENYHALAGLQAQEALSLMVSFSKKILFNVNGLRTLGLRELRLLLPKGIQREANLLLKPSLSNKLSIAPDKVGIRSQIFDDENNHLLNDFVIQKQARIIHILNAISPAFTASFGLADRLLERYIE